MLWFLDNQKRESHRKLLREKGEKFLPKSKPPSIFGWREVGEKAGY